MIGLGGIARVSNHPLCAVYEPAHGLGFRARVLPLCAAHKPAHGLGFRALGYGLPLGAVYEPPCTL